MRSPPCASVSAKPSPWRRKGRKQHYRAGMHLLKRRVCTSFRQQALRRKI
jgi:hypothetical protein